MYSNSVPAALSKGLYQTLLLTSECLKNQGVALESFGYFLKEYVIEGADITLDSVNPRKFTVSESVLSFSERLFRVFEKNFRIPNVGGTYYLDFTVENAYVVNTMHPTTPYLPLWQINTDSTGNITGIVDMRGDMGYVQFRDEIQGIITDDLIVDEAHITPNAIGTTRIQDKAVTEPKLGDGAVSNRTLSPAVASRISNLENTSTSLQQQIDAEESERINADNILNERIINIVASGGSSNVEIVDARQPATGPAFPVLKSRLDASDEQLADIVVNVKSFGAHKDNLDNHDFIMAALNYLKDREGGTLLIPEMLRTSPLVLNNDYKNIQIKGVVPNTLPWTEKSGFQFISYGKVGLQLSDCDSEVPSWRAIEISITDLYINCDQKVDAGINGNFGVYLNNVTVDYAIFDGVVLEGQTYPFIMRRVHSRYNGRHGLYVKAPYTTVYSLHQCEFNANNGYGMFIESGAGCSFKDVLCQSNKMGGVKINLRNPVGFTKPIFLDNLLFENLYLEANGTLNVSDPGYDGNYGLRVDSYDHTKYLNSGKIGNLTFINIYGGTPPGGNPALIQGVAQLSTLGLVAFFINDNTIDYAACGSINGSNAADITGLFNYNAADWLQNAKRYREQNMYNQESKQILKIGHGYLGMRGRMRELSFSLATVANAESKDMLLDGITGKVSAPIIQAGSLICLYAYAAAITAGVLQFEIRYATTDRNVLSNYLLLEPTTITPSNKTINKKYELLKYKVPETAIAIGIRVYGGGGLDGASNISAHLFIES